MSGVHELLEIAKRGGYDAKLDVESGTAVFTPRKMTNADRIRAMSDEEMAAFMERTITFAGCPSLPINCQESCAKCWLDWLKQEDKE